VQFTCSKEQRVNEFIERHRDSVIGVLSEFDRVRFRGTLRSLCHAEGLGRWLSTMKVLLKDLRRLPQRVTDGIRIAWDRERRLLVLQGALRECLHYYFYRIHPEWGFCHARAADTAKLMQVA
jgi:hypothetical protein